MVKTSKRTSWAVVVGERFYIPVGNYREASYAAEAAWENHRHGKSVGIMRTSLAKKLGYSLKYRFRRGDFLDVCG